MNWILLRRAFGVQRFIRHFLKLRSVAPKLILNGFCGHWRSLRQCWFRQDQSTTSTCDRKPAEPLPAMKKPDTSFSKKIAALVTRNLYSPISLTAAMDWTCFQKTGGAIVLPMTMETEGNFAYRHFVM